jgi:hypothetical protein
MDPPPPDEITRARGADDEITRARGADDENHPSIRRPTDGRGGDATRARDTTARAGTTTRDARTRRRATTRENARNANGRDAIRPHEKEGRGERARIDGDATTTMALETPSSLGNDDRAAMMIQAAYRRHQARADAGRRAKTTALETLEEHEEAMINGRQALVVRMNERLAVGCEGSWREGWRGCGSRGRWGGRDGTTRRRRRRRRCRRSGRRRWRISSIR